MKRILLALTMLAAAISGARAVSIFSDNFDYPDGSISASSGGSWVTDGALGTPLMVTNSTLILTTSRSEDCEHVFPSIYTTNGSVAALYSSFTLRMGGQLPTAGGTYIAHFSGTNAFTTPTPISGFRARIFLSATNFQNQTATPGQYYIAIGNSNLGNNTNAPWSAALISNITYTVVTRLVLSNGISTLWINPTAETDPGATATDVVDDFGGPNVTNGIINISSYGFRQATGEGADDKIDLFKVGTTFADVAGPNTAPSITGIATQSIPMNGATGPIPFTVADDGGVGSVTVTAASSNPTLIGTGSIVFGGGTGANRTVTLTPNSSQQGVSTITLTATDGVNSTPISFLLQVGFPTIGTVTNFMTYSNQAPIVTTVTVGDAESTAAGVSVSNSVFSINQSLITSVNVTGSGATRTVTITPAVDQTGLATITLYARDPQFNLVQTSFKVTVSPKYGIVLSDTFSYNSFTFADPSSIDGADGTIWSKAGTQGGISGEMQVTNGYVTITSSNSEDVASSLLVGGNPTSFDPTNGVILYASFDINPQSLPSPLGDYFAHFRDTLTGSTFRAKIFSTHTNSAGDSVIAADSVRIGIANAANNASVIYPVDIPTNTTAKVVVKLNTATGECWLWVNPIDETTAAVTATDTTSGTTVAAFGLRESDFEGTIHLDNLKIGSVFTDVFTPIPQSSLSIVLSGGLTTVTWGNPGTFFLQSSTNVLGPYFYTTNAGVPATSPYTATPTKSSQFYRTVNVVP